MATRPAAHGVQPRPLSRAEARAQTLGGRRRGGINDPAVTDARPGAKRSRAIPPITRAPAESGAKVWKHLRAQPASSGQTFCGQCGQCFIDPLQGIGASVTDALMPL